jgi:ABC-type Fe3+-hydroxamate transport system substrate-binding protein
MPTFTDQTGRSILLTAPPGRIISLVPSQTEFLYALGLDAEVVGITRFCVHPKSWFRSKARIGGTKQLHIDQILALQPDLIIANKEENTEEQVLALASELPVWVSDVASLDDALQMMLCIGEITGRLPKAQEICTAIGSAFAALQPAALLKTAYLIWQSPYMTVGGDTFIHDMLGRCGLINVFRDNLRYPQISLEQLRDSGIELLLLSSEPYPFKTSDMALLQEILPGVRIMLVDGEYFSWYGSRLLGAADYFTQFIAAIQAILQMG